MNGAALGDEKYVELKLLQKQRELCGDETADPPTPGTLMRIAQEVYRTDAHATHAATHFSLQTRAD